MDSLFKYKKAQLIGLIITVLPIILIFLFLNHIDNEYLFEKIFGFLVAIGISILGIIFAVVSRFNYLKVKKQLISQGLIFEKRNQKIQSIIFSLIALFCVGFLFYYLNSDFRNYQKELRNTSERARQINEDRTCKIEKLYDQNHQC